jgi:hypothetical protein
MQVGDRGVGTLVFGRLVERNVLGKSNDHALF